MKVCLIRLDKIGDLVCTLPVDEVPWLEGHQIRWVIQQSMGFVASNAVPGRRFLQLNKKSKWESFRALIKFLREEDFQVAVSFQSPWWVNFALWWAKVPLRAGVLSQWHSFLFLNRGLRQRRSQAVKHEADYNLDVLAHALGKDVEKIPLKTDAEVILCPSLDRSPLMVRAPRFRLRAPDHPDLWTRLPFQRKQYLVVHPGMAGSARNWPQKSYVSLIESLSTKLDVVVTGTPSDEAFLSEVRQVQGKARVHWLVGEVTSSELLSVLLGARAVVAPSTGVAHLGAALGVPVLSLFSSKPVERPQRWAPRGEEVVCFEPKEDHDSSMTMIPVEALLAELPEGLR